MSKPVTFIQAPVLSSAPPGNSGDSGHSHPHDHAHAHDHDHAHNHAHDHGAQEHGHTHEVMEHPGQCFEQRWSRKALPRVVDETNRIDLKLIVESGNTGKFAERDLPDYSGRDWKERGFTIGIGGPVGSGKTALTLALCRIFRDTHNIAVVTNDIFTKEDQVFLIRNEALSDKGRIRAIETGGCPHAAIREDISANIGALEGLQADYGCDMLFVESGGDNLAANYSRELADYIIYVIDVSGGDKIPRKGGPGISQSDLLVVNKIDLAPYVGASLEVMKRDADKMRDHGPTLFTSVKLGQGVDGVVELIKGAWKAATGGHSA